MKRFNRALAVEQLDGALRPYGVLLDAPRPQKGWLRAIREALGMSGAQLGSRLGLTKVRVSRIEQDEIAGKLTMETLRRVADAMDCVFVYAVVPKTSLADTVKERARLIARQRAERVAHTMRLEDQALSSEEIQQEIELEVERLIKTMPRSLWDT